MNKKTSVKKTKKAKRRKDYKPIKYKIVMVASLLVGVIGLSMILPNITGNVISNLTKNSSSWIGLILLFTGAIGFFVANREMRGETGKLLEILVVEDKDKNLEAAKKCFSEMGGLKVTYATDYESGMEALRKGEYDGVITDLFMPEKTGSNKKDLGREVIIEAKEYLDKIGYKGKAKELMPKLTQYLESGDEANQPLGVKIAEESYRRKTPVLIATSESGHGSVSLPVLKDIDKRILNKVGLKHVKKNHPLANFTLYSAISTKPSPKNTPECWKDVYKQLVGNEEKLELVRGLNLKDPNWRTVFATLMEQRLPSLPK